MNFLPFSPIPLDHETIGPEERGRFLQRYLVAVVAVAIALAARWMFQGILADTMPYTLFMPAVLAGAYYGGFGPGLVALLLSGVAGNYFFQKPYDELSVATTAAATRLALSLVAGLAICVMGGLFQSARRRTSADARELIGQAERFRASDENYRRMFETAYEGICCLDDSDHVIYVNGRLVDMLGYSIIGMVGHPISDFLFAEDWPRLKGELEARRQGGKGVFDFRFRRKNGSALFCIVSTQPIFNRDGNYRGSMNMVTDITARQLSAEDVNQLLDRLKVQLRALRDLQQAALVRLGRPEDHRPETAEPNLLDEARQAITRSVEMADQMSEMLRTGNARYDEPASHVSTARAG